jgi:site-specific recombinase XerD
MLAYNKYDIAFFIDEKEKTRWSHLLKEFVENDSERHISRQKLSDYLKELCDEGLVQKTIDKKALALRMLWRVYPIYIVPKNRKKRLDAIRDKREIYEFIDSASPERIGKLHETIESLRKTKEENVS